METYSKPQQLSHNSNCINNQTRLMGTARIKSVKRGWCIGLLIRAFKSQKSIQVTIIAGASENAKWSLVWMISHPSLRTLYTPHISTSNSLSLFFTKQLNKYRNPLEILAKDVWFGCMFLLSIGIWYLGLIYTVIAWLLCRDNVNQRWRSLCFSAFLHVTIVLWIASGIWYHKTVQFVVICHLLSLIVLQVFSAYSDICNSWEVLEDLQITWTSKWSWTIKM